MGRLRPLIFEDMLELTLQERVWNDGAFLVLAAPIRRVHLLYLSRIFWVKRAIWNCPVPAPTIYRVSTIITEQRR